jgi:gas vesicle protein
MTKKHSGKQFLLGAMIGSSIGALSVLMLKTKKGSTLQKNAVRKLHAFENYIERFVSGGKEKVAKTVKTICKTVQKRKSSKKKNR